jgi:hypothetical protein
MPGFELPAPEAAIQKLAIAADIKEAREQDQTAISKFIARNGFHRLGGCQLHRRSDSGVRQLIGRRRWCHRFPIDH